MYGLEICKGGKWAEFTFYQSYGGRVAAGAYYTFKTRKSAELKASKIKLNGKTPQLRVFIR